MSEPGEPIGEKLDIYFVRNRAAELRSSLHVLGCAVEHKSFCSGADGISPREMLGRVSECAKEIDEYLWSPPAQRMKPATCIELLEILLGEKKRLEYLAQQEGKIGEEYREALQKFREKLEDFKEKERALKQAVITEKK